MIKPIGKIVSPNDPVGHATAWRSKLSAAHRGPRPGKQTVQKAPKLPSNKTRF